MLPASRAETSQYAWSFAGDGRLILMLGGVLPWMERACSPCDIIHNLRCGGATGLCYVLQRYLRLHDEHFMIIWSSTLSPLSWCMRERSMSRERLGSENELL